MPNAAEPESDEAGQPMKRYRFKDARIDEFADGTYRVRTDDKSEPQWFRSRPELNAHLKDL